MQIRVGCGRRLPRTSTAGRARPARASSTRGERMSGSNRLLEIQSIFSRALAEGRGISDTVPKALDAVVQGMNWDAGGLWLPEDGDRIMAAEIAVCSPDLRAGTLEEGSRLAAQVWKASAPVRARRKSSSVLRSGYGVPIQRHSKIVGVL